MKSIWFLAFLAMVVNLLTTAGLFMMNKDAFFPPKGEEEHVEEEEVDFISTWAFNASEIYKLVEGLAEQKQRYEERERLLAEREARVTAERQEIERLREQIKTSREQFTQYINARLTEIDSNDQETIKKMVSIYSSMQPAALISVLTETDEEDVVKILGLMKTDKVTAIFEEMIKSDPENAKKVALLTDKLRKLKLEK